MVLGCPFSERIPRVIMQSSQQVVHVHGGNEGVVVKFLTGKVHDVRSQCEIEEDRRLEERVFVW